MIKGLKVSEAINKIQAHMINIQGYEELPLEILKKISSILEKEIKLLEKKER